MKEDLQLLVGVVVFGWVGYWVCRTLGTFLFDYFFK